MSSTRIVQVGLGGWGRNWYSEVLDGFPGVDVVALVDQSAVALDLARKQLAAPGDRYYGSLELALAEVECDAVVITTSLPGHIPSAVLALEAGKHVLTEKPFAPSIEDANRAIRAAERSGRVLMVSQNYRFYPAPRTALQYVLSGELGALGAVHVDFRRSNVAYRKQSQKHYSLEHPLLADMAIHHFDLMRMVVGSEPRIISIHAYNPPWSHYTYPPAAGGTIEFENGVVVSYRGSWVSPGPTTPWAGEWRMEFEKGELRWQSRGDFTAGDDRVSIRRIGEEEKDVPMHSVDRLDREGSLAAFLEATSGGSNYENSGESNRGSIAMVFAAIESAETGRPVEVRW